jgi:hypothetical protein
VSVKVPIEAFGRKASAPINGDLWLTTRQTAATRYFGVLLVPDPERPEAALTSLAEELSANGFHTLLIEPRNNDKQLQKTLVEDVQSGVVFLKTDQRVGAVKVLIVALGASANAAANYASASKQMSLILEGVALLNPGKELKKTAFSDSIKGIQRIPLLLVSTQTDILDLSKRCQTSCQILKSDTDSVLSTKKPLIEFLLRPHG